MSLSGVKTGESDVRLTQKRSRRLSVGFAGRHAYERRQRVREEQKEILNP